LSQEFDLIRQLGKFSHLRGDKPNFRQQPNETPQARWRHPARAFDDKLF
jgi:hypothetical protein